MSNGNWKPQNGWSWGDIAAVLAMIVTVVVFTMRLESGIKENAQAIASEVQARLAADKVMEQRMSRTDDRNTRLYQDIRDSLVRLEKKVDEAIRDK